MIIVGGFRVQTLQFYFVRDATAWKLRGITSSANQMNRQNSNKRRKMRSKTNQMQVSQLLQVNASVTTVTKREKCHYFLLLLPLSIGSWFDEVIDNLFTLKAYISDQYLLIEENWSTAFTIFMWNTKIKLWKTGYDAYKWWIKSKINRDLREDSLRYHDTGVSYQQQAEGKKFSQD